LSAIQITADAILPFKSQIGTLIVSKLSSKKIMETTFRKISRFAIFALIAISLVMSSCKSKKLAREAAQAKAQQEEALRKQKEEELKKKEAEEKARKEEPERLALEAKSKALPSLTGAAKLEQYFSAIAGAANVNAANNSINEALSMFSSDQTPVLIVISEEGGDKDYDKPTTIKAYLNYLKDQKKNINRVSNLVTDSSGKIKEVELVKQK
jgi:mannitol-specific phosphotransferase system IIBC component